MFVEDTFPPAPLDLSITFIGHSTLMLRHGGVVVHVDPVGQYADYRSMPKADMVLVTHEHFDHLDPQAIAAVRTGTTVIIAAAKCAGKVPGALILRELAVFAGGGLRTRLCISRHARLRGGGGRRRSMLGR